MIPDWLDTDAWEGFLEMRKCLDKKHPWTARAEKMALKKLEMFYNQGHDPNEILDQSTFMGWKGLFLVKRDEQSISGRPISRRDQSRNAIDSLGSSEESLGEAGQLRVIK